MSIYNLTIIRIWEVIAIDTIDRILQLAKEKGIKQSHINTAINGYRGKMTDWKNRKSSPNPIELAMVAQLLDTTEAYLRGETEDASSHTLNQTKPMDPRIKKILQQLEDMSVEELSFIENLIETMKAKRK